jgi:rhodanese-related sulfurtransferase
MKKLLFLLLVLSSISCTQTAVQAQSGKLNPAEFESILSKDKTVQLVDVRTPEEYAAGHIEGARLIDFYDTDFATRIGKLDKNKPVLVYCAAGGRSASAAEQLNKMGFKKVYDLAGGMRAWRAAGKKAVQ